MTHYKLIEKGGRKYWKGRDRIIPFGHNFAYFEELEDREKMTEAINKRLRKNFKRIRDQDRCLAGYMRKAALYSLTHSHGS